MDDRTPRPLIDVEIEADLYDYLKSKSTFEDTLSSVLRRELGLSATETAADSEPPTRPRRVVREDEGEPRATPRRKRRAGARRPRAAAGTLLPESEYFRPILELLDERGGRAPKQVVIEELGRRLDDKLTDADRDELEHGGIRWRNRSQFARLRLIERGLMDRTAPRGIWAITDEGRSALRGGTI
jgi:hypothetical protein